MKIIGPSRDKAIFVKELLNCQIYLRGMIFCCPDLMIASRHLEGVERKIIKIFAINQKEKFKRRHD